MIMTQKSVINHLFFFFVSLLKNDTSVNFFLIVNFFFSLMCSFFIKREKEKITGDFKRTIKDLHYGY